MDFYREATYSNATLIILNGIWLFQRYVVWIPHALPRHGDRPRIGTMTARVPWHHVSSCLMINYVLIKRNVMGSEFRFMLVGITGDFQDR